ncbi:hypothetical protein FIT92_04045 [Candidatus Methylopumilus universalis]|uniref:Heparin-sulfate lyase N-terminal domain-containing protein n=1 Tax=Candidatus Methylopumilus universalis TaxID=2588536 RepID=A0AAX1EZT9_9PROT|nr:heparinase II/III family protein [Candidatus Methylopumilus universalis]QDC41232.1 hypothetical protein FIT94_04045 [Candidatus Methylopumilus universalis]QDC42522.1 hypothetical protein FIT95_04050 [Candidatus Methylopumilus universalis]QDC56189.1 hypothetical protein FIT98_04050 [Candidatus Methylopumilus universalis]QDC57471.1 hypothetical protein FIT96_04045 [Candidatus Methylopumilus universalis]QDC58761.1 hypothetical protein FIT92_04045 [Candidatus Methylopumilus universalis]
MRFIRTVSYLKYSQILGQFFYLFYRPQKKYLNGVGRNPKLNFLRKFPPKNAFIDKNLIFTSINLSYRVSDKSIWNNKSIDYLWLYNLHYFDYINSKSSPNFSTSTKIIIRWINEHGHGIGWEPYPTSLRIVNWIKFSLKNSFYPENFISSLATQSNYLYKNQEFHIDSNHLFTNGKALFFAGNFFVGKESSKWAEKGAKLIFRALESDFLHDGGHSERSVMYHLIVLEDLLDIYNLILSLDIAIYTSLKVKLANTIKKAFLWLNFMILPNGKFPLFGDSAEKIALSIKNIYLYSNTLGIDVKYSHKEYGYLPFSNFAKLQASKNIFLYLTLDGPKPSYQPGHSHADSLSFELYNKNEVLLCDAGVGNYLPGPLRDYCRSTAAHNTLEINSLNSSEAWGCFRFGRRAVVSKKRYKINKNEANLTASHNGYSYLNGKPIHERTWKIERNKKTIEVIDKISGAMAFDVAIRFRASPRFIWRKNKNMWNLISLYDGICFLTLYANTNLKYGIEEGIYFPEFNKPINCSVLVARGSQISGLNVSHKLLLL